MSKNIVIKLSIIIIAVFCIGFGLIKVYSKIYDNQKMKEIKILTELPLEIERTNPVPEVRNWSSDDRSFYYFNWGLKPTTGYDLSLLSFNGNKIIIQASSPEAGSINAQVITYPHLLLSLPKGDYHYEIVDEHNRPLKDIFHPENPPLKLNISIPSGSGDIFQRKVLRDPYLNNEGKTTAQIALEALFAQDEMMDYLNHEVLIEGVSFSASHKKWFVLLSRGYQTLSMPEKELLNQLITETVLATKAANLETVEITTDPLRLPPLEN